jgi:hypothetical protein
MNVKYQIFVSSTYEDLKDERNEVIKACLNMGHIPVGMEMFNAADEEQWAVIQRTIDQCDYYVIIVAHRYGSTTREGISFTEKEYDYAVAQGVPVLRFVIDDEAPWPSKFVDKQPSAVKALQHFKAKVKQKIVRFWRDKAELQAHFAMSLTTAINLNPRVGWVRAPEPTDVDIAQVLSKLTEENARLRQALDEKQTLTLTDTQISDIVRILYLDRYPDPNLAEIVKEIGDAERNTALLSPINYLDSESAIFSDLKYYGIINDDLKLTILGHIIYRRLKAQ